jgi:hypothetical protein
MADVYLSHQPRINAQSWQDYQTRALVVRHVAVRKRLPRHDDTSTLDERTAHSAQLAVDERNGRMGHWRVLYSYPDVSKYTYPYLMIPFIEVLTLSSQPQAQCVWTSKGALKTP